MQAGRGFCELERAKERKLPQLRQNAELTNPDKEKGSRTQELLQAVWCSKIPNRNNRMRTRCSHFGEPMMIRTQLDALAGKTLTNGFSGKVKFRAILRDG
jgi:hypothetical protein